MFPETVTLAFGSVFTPETELLANKLFIILDIPTSEVAIDQ